MEYVESIIEEVEIRESEADALDMLALTEALADIAKELGR